MWQIARVSISAHKRRLLAVAVAVLLAVAFLSSTLVVQHTVTRGFLDVLEGAYAGTDVVVRPALEYGQGDVSQRALIDRSLTNRLEAVDGVAAAAPVVEVEARIIAVDGDPIGGGGSTAGNWIEDPRLNPYELVEGRAPTAPREVVIDRASAREGGLAVGDEALVRTPDPIDATIVGLVTFGTAEGRGSDTYVGFTTEFAQRVLLSDGDAASYIAIAAEPGLTEAQLVSQLAPALPQTVEVLTSTELIRESADRVQGEDHHVFQQALMFFSAVALLVVTLSIYNTFSILVAQRAHELAVLRALGASRRQVFGAVVAEASGVGLFASLGGLGAGLGLAWALLHLMDTIGLATPAAPVVLDASTVWFTLAVGTVVAVLASLAPAVKASRVAPLAAMRDAAIDQPSTKGWRAATGAVVTAAGVALTVIGAVNETVPATGIGAAATFAGVLLLGPFAVRPAVAVLGAPLAAGNRITGVLARRNVTRNPTRAARTAVSLMIGVMVVSLFTVVAESLKKSINDAVDRQFAGDLVIVGEGRGGLSTDLAAEVAKLPQVAAASPSGGAQVQIDGENTLALTFDPATIQSVMDLDVPSGSLRDVGPDEAAISTRYAESRGLALGDDVTIGYADGATERVTIAAIYNDEMSEGGDVRLPREAVLPHLSRPTDVNLWIALEHGVPNVRGETAVQQVADRFGAPDVQTADEFTTEIAGEIDQFLTVIYVLLIIAVAIACMSITNTLSLSVHERTRELGLLRAVGQTQLQVRTMVRNETIIVSLLGTVTGLCLGAFFAWAIVSALAEEGFGSFATPGLPLAMTLTFGALAGALSAAVPARRAARLDVLSAISAE